MSMSLTEGEGAVAIAGAGPTGMMLAAELALAEVEVALLERRPGRELEGSRAGGLHSRTIEILDQRGVAERFVAAGEQHAVALFADAKLDLGDMPTRHPYVLALWQKQIERIMAEWLGELGVRARFGCEVSGFAQDEGGVEVRLADGGSLRASYLVGCDGGRSAVRKAAGIDFPGWAPSVSALIAEAEMSGEPEHGVRHGELGINAIAPNGEDGAVRVVVTERQLESADEPSLEELRAALLAVYGTDYGLHSPTWISRFTDATRQAAAYRDGRVLLAGDSAHIHYPAGGQGIQQGIQDAVNLGWKLAQVVKGVSPDSLLDSYQAERHPPTAAALRETMAAGALHRGDPRTAALRETLTELATMEQPRRQLAARRTGLEIRYDLGPGHPLLGRRMPDLDLDTGEGALRVYALLHDARPLLLDLGLPDGLGLEAAPGPDRVRVVAASYRGAWELPALGEVPAPTGVLVRPDGHVAWVAAPGDSEDSARTTLREALTRWFGPPGPGPG